MLGKPAVAPVQRVRAAATRATDTAKTVAQGSEKIIVSNLPADVNEAQVKVCQWFLLHQCVFCYCLILTGYRSCSTRPLDLSRRLPFITTRPAAQKVSPLSPSKGGGMGPRPFNNTITDSLTAVSIVFLSAFRTLQSCLVWFAQMNSRLMILRAFFLASYNAFPPLFFRTSDEDWNCCWPFKTSLFGISSWTRPRCYQWCSDAGPKVGQLRCSGVLWFIWYHPELVVVPLVDDASEVRAVLAKLSHSQRLPPILTPIWRFVFWWSLLWARSESFALQDYTAGNGPTAAA